MINWFHNQRGNHLPSGVAERRAGGEAGGTWGRGQECRNVPLRTDDAAGVPRGDDPAKVGKHRQVTVYCADFSDTLEKIAIKQHLAPEDLLRLNAQQYPGVTLTSALAEGTRVVLPRAGLADWETSGGDGGSGGGKSSTSGEGAGGSGSGRRTVEEREVISSRRNYYNEAQRHELQVVTVSS